MRNLKVLVAHPEKCTGCRRCELWCSLMHFKIHNPNLAAIHVHECSPLICKQCGICLNSCPVQGALKRVPSTGAIQVTSKCIGCGHCVASCPHGMITLFHAEKRAIKCDLCGGDPACVKHCPADALEYVEINKGAEIRRINSLKMNNKLSGKRVII